MHTVACVCMHVHVCAFPCACEHVGVCFGSGLVRRVRRLVVSLCVHWCERAVRLVLPLERDFHLEEQGS